MTSLPSFVQPHQGKANQANQLAKPAAPYAPPTPRPLSNTNPLVPRSNRDLPASTVQAQSVEIVRGAIDQMAQGFFQQVADLSQYMKRDSAFTAAMEKRVLGLLRNDFQFTPASSSPRDIAVCAAVKRFWARMAPEVELRLWVQWFHLLDLSVASVDWSFELDEDSRVWHLPTLRTRHMRWFYYDVSRSSLVDISADGVNTVDPLNGRYVVANAWRYGFFGGKASSLGEDWIEKVFARRDWAEWSDFYSWPIFKAVVPAGGLGDENVSGNFVNGLQQNARNRTVVVERGTDGNNTYDFDVVKMGDNWEGFPERIAMLDRKFQVAWLGGNLSSEVTDQGARAASQTQQSAETRLIQSDNVLLSSVLRDSLVRFFVTMNFGANTPCPDIGWVVGEELAQQQRGAALKDLAAFLKDIPPTYEIGNLGEIAQMFGVQLRKVSSPALPPLTGDGDPQPSQDAPPPVAKVTNGKPAKDAQAAPQKEPAALPAKRSIKKVAQGKWRTAHGVFATLEEARASLGNT